MHRRKESPLTITADTIEANRHKRGVSKGICLLLGLMPTSTGWAQGPQPSFSCLQFEVTERPLDLLVCIVPPKGAAERVTWDWDKGFGTTGFGLHSWIITNFPTCVTQPLCSSFPHLPKIASNILVSQRRLLSNIHICSYVLKAFTKHSVKTRAPRGLVMQNAVGRGHWKEIQDLIHM